MSGHLARWRGAVAAAAVLAVVGVLDRNGVLVLAAAVPLVYVVYGSLSTATVPPGLRATREVEPTPAPPGRTVRVRLTVTNESDRALSDLRVVDGVPADLAVVEGTPRAGTTLDVGEHCVVEYAVVARRGEHDFTEPRARVRGAGAGAVATTTLDVEGGERLDCRLDADAPPLYEQGREFVGQMTAGRPGRGGEFHSTREHRRGDPASRIDWRGYAKRRELSTVNYDRRVSTTAVLVLDARQYNRVVAGPGRPTAVEFEAYAATRALSALLGAGHDVGVAVLGVEGTGPGGIEWLPPGSGEAHRARALETFRRVTDGRIPSARVDPRRQVRELVDLAPATAQLAYLSPFLDDHPVEAVESWAAAGLPVVVLSPDVVPSNTVSGAFEGVRRRTRLARCHGVGARVIDWRRSTPLAIVLEYAFATEARLASREPAPGASGPTGPGTGTATGGDR